CELHSLFSFLAPWPSCFYPLSLHDALPIWREDTYRLPIFSQRFNAGLGAFWWSHVPRARLREFLQGFHKAFEPGARVMFMDNLRSEEHTSELQSLRHLVCRLLLEKKIK